MPDGPRRVVGSGSWCAVAVDIASGWVGCCRGAAKEGSSWSVRFFMLRIELTTDEAADSGMGALGREGNDPRAAAARVWGGGSGFSPRPLEVTGAETRRVMGSDGRRLGVRLIIVAFVGVVGTGVAFGLRSASGARLAATTREAGRFRAALVEPVFVEPETPEEERGLLCPFACVSGGERRGIMWTRAKRLRRSSGGQAVSQCQSVSRIRKVRWRGQCIPRMRDAGCGGWV